MLRRFVTVVVSLLLLSQVMTASVFAAKVNLLQICEIALDHNYAIRSTYNAYQSVHMAEKVSLGTLLPNFSAIGSLSSTNIDNKTGSGSYKSSAIQLNLTQVLFDYGLYKTYQASKETTQQSKASYQYSYQQLLLNVSNAYFNVLLAKDQLEYANANVKSLESALDQASVKYKVGISTEADVKQAEASYYNGLAEQVAAKNNLDTSYYALYQFTGILHKDLATLKPDLDYKSPVPTNVDYWVKTAIMNNNNYLSQKYQENAAYETMQASYGSFLPSVSLVAQYTNTTNFGDQNVYTNIAGLNKSQANGYVGLTLSWNIFNGGSDYATKVQNARLYTAQEFNTLETYRTLLQNVRSAYLNIGDFISQVIAYKQAVKASELAYKQFLEQYNVGTATITDVLDQLQSLFQTKSSLAQAKYSYFNSLLQLKLDAGTLSLNDIKAINSELNL